MTQPRSFNFADIWEMVADAVGTREAVVVGEQRRSYAELETRANRLAHHLAGQGVGAGDHVALYLENCAEYLEAMLAAFKLRAVPINVNHRYVVDELRYLLDNSDSVGVLTQPSLRSTVEAVTPGVPKVRFVLTTGEDYDTALAAAPPDRLQVDRSADDRYVIYTGGTTGLPKGVVWRQKDAFYACMGGGDPLRLHGPVTGPDQLPDRITDEPLCYLPLAPMMHAAAQWTTFSSLFCGGKVVLMPGSLDPMAAWRAVEAERAQILTVVGDAVARPLLDAWDAAGGHDVFDVSSLFVIGNGGAPLSPAMQQRLITTLPNVLFSDGFGSSEAGTQMSSRRSPDEVAEGAGLREFDLPTKPTIVVDGDGDEVQPGSEIIGHVLAGGHLPLGYYNDPDRSAEVFVERNGERWLVTGDMATVGHDGSVALVGRGSGVINTGGEKVFPEEVEAVLMAHPAVYDCLVVGVPDDRWGSVVTAVVQPVDRNTSVTLEDLVASCKTQLAGYKAPKHLVLVDRVVRSPSGKADYRWARSTAETAVGNQTSRP